MQRKTPNTGIDDLYKMDASMWFSPHLRNPFCFIISHFFPPTSTHYCSFGLPNLSAFSCWRSWRLFHQANYIHTCGWLDCCKMWSAYHRVAALPQVEWCAIRVGVGHIYALAIKSWAKLEAPCLNTQTWMSAITWYKTPLFGRNWRTNQLNKYSTSISQANHSKGGGGS